MKKGGILLMISFLSSGCDPMAEFKKIFRLNQPTAAESPKPEAFKTATAGDLAKINSELLSEIFKVTFNEQEVDDKSNFGGLVHSLNQGASLEGIYNGIVMGSRYRSLESKSKAAAPSMLRAFANEMANLQVEMKDPTEFTQESAKNAPSIEYPEGEESEQSSNATLPSAVQPNQEVKKKREKNEIATSLLEMFIGASPYTLKRVLGAEAIKRIDELKDSPGELAQWYAHVVMRMCEQKVDFGLAQRNLPEFDFHFKFAQKMAVDRVKWEVLNRYHRYLNAQMNP